MNIYLRTISGIILILIVLASLILSPYSFLGLCILINILALFEFFSLTRSIGKKPNKPWCFTIGNLLIISSFGLFMFELQVSYLLAIIPLFALIFIFELFRKESAPLTNIAFSIASVLYISLPIALFSFLVYFEELYSYKIVLGFLFLIWSNDTMAYIFGISFGKHKLMERISPKKSWEGFLGGAFFTLLLAYFMIEIFEILNRIDWLIIGLIVSIFGVLGDLIESMLKRSLNVKDSGNLIPGHGGLLDRIDSILMSLPFVFFYLILVKYII